MGSNRWENSGQSAHQPAHFKPRGMCQANIFPHLRRLKKRSHEVFSLLLGQLPGSYSAFLTRLPRYVVSPCRRVSTPRCIALFCEYATPFRPVACTLSWNRPCEGLVCLAGSCCLGQSCCCLDASTCFPRTWRNFYCCGTDMALMSCYYYYKVCAYQNVRGNYEGQAST